MVQRRAFDAHGRMFRPVTVGSMLADGRRHVLAFCSAIGCGHDGRVDVSAWPPDTFVPDVGLRLRCTACGARRSAETRPEPPYVPMKTYHPPRSD